MSSCKPPLCFHSKSKVLSFKILSYRTLLGARFLLHLPPIRTSSHLPNPPKPAHLISVDLRLLVAEGEAVVESCNLDDPGREVRWTFGTNRLLVLRLSMGLDGYAAYGRVSRLNVASYAI